MAGAAQGVLYRMERIASFSVDHTKLKPGIYRSRVDGDIVTYDLRFVQPNHPPYLSVPAIHTIEHLFATYARNSAMKEKIIYFGPMGCRTGFYLLVRDPDEEAVIELICTIMKQITEFSGPIPGASEKECGNYLEHDLRSAQREAAFYYGVIRTWTKEKLQY